MQSSLSGRGSERRDGDGAGEEAVTVADIHASSIAKKWLPNCTCKCVSSVCVCGRKCCVARTMKRKRHQPVNSSVQFSSAQAEQFIYIYMVCLQC